MFDSPKHLHQFHIFGKEYRLYATDLEKARFKDDAPI